MSRTTARALSSRQVLLSAAVALLFAGCATAPPTTTSPTPAPSITATSVTPRTPLPVPSTTPEPSPAAVTPRPARPTDTRGAALNRPFTVDGVIVVSKAHRITAAYNPARVSPNGLTAPTQAALSKLQAAARKAGVRVVVRSGYRSYATQAAILASKIKEYGSEALARRYNAAPGRSEHQTGLAVDLWDGVTWGLAVRDTATGKWLWANAWRYGFILRYPPGKEAITGYAFEPWHYRYVGVEVAAAFGRNSTLTLEQYLRLR